MDATAQDFSPLADALMSSLASRSHQWRRWEIHDVRLHTWESIVGTRIEVVPLETNLVWVVAETREGRTAERVVSPTASASQTILDLFDETKRFTGESARWAAARRALRAATWAPERNDGGELFALERQRLEKAGVPATGLRLEIWRIHSKDSAGHLALSTDAHWLWTADSLILQAGPEFPSARITRLA